MDDVVEISGGLENACRLCLTTEQTRSSIFGVPHVSVPFAEKIRVCLSIQVTTSDKLSTLVCATCIKNINHWHSYKDTCLKAQDKLQQWLAKHNTIIQPIQETIKEEPLDADYPNESSVPVTNHVNTTNDATPHIESMEVDKENISTPVKNTSTPALTEQPSRIDETIDDEFNPDIHIKSEPIDTEDEVDIESVNSGELLINPMAVAVANNVNKDRVMEADSTQKPVFKRKFGSKKNMRRGPRTHYRGLRLFKKKCDHCKINLHSKFSFNQHMSRYHGIVNNMPIKDVITTPGQPPVSTQKSKLSHQVDPAEPDTAEDLNKSNPEDAEFEKMIKTDPLTQVQKNIIGQLKTFSCYTCKQSFFDRRHTLNHIRQHMPDLRPYTCIACLTEFSDRSMYKLHCGASFECAMKIALVVPKVGNEKYFTCNMCLKPFDDRQNLLTHLAQHAEKQHKQLSQPVIKSSAKLKPLSQSSPIPRVESSPSKRPPTNVPAGPYMGGDPAHNHMCDLCGMIYRYKPNMFKHRELCNSLAENIRTSYRCVHCNMTYLVYKKFYTHVYNDHKKRDITCFTCYAKFHTADDYLAHHETHRTYSDKENMDDATNESEYAQDSPAVDDPLNSSQHPTDVAEKPFNCALCGEDFATKLELSEHRNLHLKVKIYSCVICRSMFSSSGALELHMKEHGIEDPSEQNANSSCVEYGTGNQSGFNESSRSAMSDPGSKLNRCHECGKNFSNYANLKRHERNLHVQKLKRRWSCDECKRRFKSEAEYNDHVILAHGTRMRNTPRVVSPPQPPQPQFSPLTGKPVMQCPKCPKTFTYQGNLILHCQNVHKENPFERAPSRPAVPARKVIITPEGHACDICGKAFREEQSLKTHRGWHLRTNRRWRLSNVNANINTSLNSSQNSTNSTNSTVMSGPGYTVTVAPTTTPKPAKARKSFPNNPSQKQLDTIAPLQCQVCDDRFSDVAELRKHLWDVHCARNKPEKSFASELQCELCTNKFTDEDALSDHMKWHSDNPILSGHSNDNNSSSAASSHEPPRKNFCCDVCGKYYSNRKMFMRHKKLHKVLPASSMMHLQSLQTKRPSCTPCQKSFSTDASYRRHKASPCHHNAVRMAQVPPWPAKKITTTAIVHHPPDTMRLQSIKKEPGSDSSSPVPVGTKKRPVTCHICKMIFPNMSVLYQHKQLVHKVPQFKNKASDGQQAECVPLMSAEGLVCCNLCGKQFPGISNLKQHFAHKHRVKSTMFPCTASGCKLVFSSLHSLKSHEGTHSSIIYFCNLCDRHVFSRTAMSKHLIMMHKAVYQSGANKSSFWSETDLTYYKPKELQNTVCPKCKIRYPNLRALKIHYLKFHDNTKA